MTYVPKWATCERCKTFRPRSEMVRDRHRIRRWTCKSCPSDAPDSGRSSPCSNYTARSWSPGSEQPEDDRCVNCNQSHGPAVGGSESRVAPGQPADGERSAPPTDLGLDSGSDPRAGQPQP